MFRLFYFTSYFTSERVLSLGKPGAVILPQTQHALYRRHYYCFMNVCREDTVSIKELKFFLLQTSCHYSRLIQRAAKRYHREEVRSRKQIILIDVEGKNLGTMKMAIAVQLADSEGLELVVVSIFHYTPYPLRHDAWDTFNSISSLSLKLGWVWFLTLY